MENIKYFKYTFNINRYKNYKRNLIYREFQLFQKIKFDGIKIRDKAKYSVTYIINEKLLRKIKIKNINENLNKDEKFILYFIEKSVEISKDDLYVNNWHYYSAAGDFYHENENEDIIQKKLQKQFLKNQSKFYNQKGKQYENKARFRK